MTFEEQISTLYKMRFLENEGDNIEVFENILNELSHQGTNDIIPNLCTIFEDDIAEPSAGDYLIETILYIAKRNGLEEGFHKLAIGITKMLPHAEFWAERIHRTILNSKDLVVPYIKSLENIDNATKQIIKGIFLVVKEEVNLMGLKELINFLNQLENSNIFYKLNKIRNEAIMVEIAVPGQRWEVEFMEDGTVEIEKFISDKDMYDVTELEMLFRNFSD